MTSTLKRVLIMAGGTGGHIFPGLAVARYLREQGIEVHWLGTPSGLEMRLVPEANIPLHLIQITGLRGKGVKKLLGAPFAIMKAIRESKRIINTLNPDIVIGMGGFVSGPGGIASWICKRPLIIHEQNAKAGLTNKLLAKIAKRVLQGFPGAFSAAAKVITIGNPVRQEIEALPPPKARLKPQPTGFRLLIIGGSLGAQALNEVVPRALAKVQKDSRPEVMHQAGDKHAELAKRAYMTAGVEATVVPFMNDMAAAYSWADMVLCRAGALTVSELCMAGVGAILVPFPYAVDDHQTANANFMVNHAAALCIQQSELTDIGLAEVISTFAKAPEKRMAMAEAAYALRNSHVAKKIFDILLEVLNTKR